MRRTSRAFLVLTGACLLAGCQEDSHPPRVRPVLSVVVERQAGVTGSFAGTIEPRYSSSHAFRVLGRVITREVNVGDIVKKGGRLASLDPVVLDFAVNDARAAVADAAAQLSNVAAAAKRIRALFDENHATSQQLDSVQQARTGAEAAVTRTNSMLEKALEQRSYADLNAEFDGVVTAVATEIGQVVTPGQPVVTVARPDVREAIIDVPEDIAGDLREGSRFRIELQVAPAVRANGQVREIAPRVDTLTRSRRVKIALDDPPSDFRLGTTVTAFATAQPTGDIEIPATALFDRDGRQHVWIVDSSNRTVSERQVTISGSATLRARISTGLEPGDRIVRAGVHSLEPGQPVRLPEEAKK